ncbi:MAG: hypothetical protein NC293_07720 [Roseburia sp.]|nr:hypothetical protein [Roseburia sp.]
MVGKRHPDLKWDIKRYISQLDMSKIAHIDFFIDSTYHDSGNGGRTGRRYQICGSLYQEKTELCDLERNKLLHYMYQTIQEDMDINLKSYLNVYRFEVDNDSVSIFHMICSVEKLYEKAVEMNRNVIERKRVYGQ